MVRLSVINNVTISYFNLLALDKQIYLTEKLIEAQTEIYKLNQKLYNLGVGDLISVSVLPKIDFPTIQVLVSLPWGCPPTTMASSIALPLEKQFSTISDIDSMSSVNSNGTTQITLQFNSDRDIDAAAQDIQAAISSAAKQLTQRLTYSALIS